VTEYVCPLFTEAGKPTVHVTVEGEMTLEGKMVE
jgi:hypothetical protein